MTYTDQMLLDRWPHVPWLEPIMVRRPDSNQQHYACRICIARYGLKGDMIPQLPVSADAVTEHIVACHPSVVKKQ